MEILVSLLLIGGLAYLVTRRRDGAVKDRGWDHTPAASEEVAQPRSGTGRFVVALGRVEGRVWLRTPSCWFGLLFCGLLMSLFLVTWGSNDATEFPAASRGFPIFIYPLAGMVLLGAHRAVTRGRRDGTEELYSSLPAPPATRTGGHLLGVLAAVPCGLALVSVWSVVVFCNGIVGTPGWRDLAEMLMVLALLICAGVLGVALARLAPWGVVPVIALVMIAMLNGRLLEGRTGQDRMRWLAPWGGLGDVRPRFDTRPLWEHLVYLLGLAGICVAIALLVHVRRRAMVAVLVGALAVAVAGGVWQVQPLPAARAEALAAQIADPAAHQTCRTRARVTACAYPPYDANLDGWLSITTRTLAPVPRRDGYRMLQVLRPEDRGNLDAAIRRRLPAAWMRPWPKLHAQVLGFERFEGTNARLSHALPAAQWAVGLPYEPIDNNAWDHRDETPCTAAGTARAAIALWLAAQGTADDDAVRNRLEPDRAGPSGAIYTEKDGDIQAPADSLVDFWDLDKTGVPAAVAFSRADLANARALLELPTGRVAALLTDQWDTLIAPSTPSTRLADAFGIDVRADGPHPEVDAC